MSITMSGGNKLLAFLDKLEQDVKKNESVTVEVGYFPEDKIGDTPAAAIAARQEFGVPKGNIPPRPTMRPGVRMTRKKISEIAKELGVKNISDLPDKIGEAAVESIKDEIKNKNRPALSETTKKIRRERKIKPTTSDKPLIDSGAMLDAVKYKKSSS